MGTIFFAHLKRFCAYHFLFIALLLLLVASTPYNNSALIWFVPLSSINIISLAQKQQTMSSKQRSYSTMNPLRHDDARAAITDALSVMMKQERTTYACHDYPTAPKTHQASSNTPKITITTSDRQRVID